MRRIMWLCVASSTSRIVWYHVANNGISAAVKKKKRENSSLCYDFCFRWTSIVVEEPYFLVCLWLDRTQIRISLSKELCSCTLARHCRILWLWTLCSLNYCVDREEKLHIADRLPLRKSFSNLFSILGRPDNIIKNFTFPPPFEYPTYPNDKDALKCFGEVSGSVFPKGLELVHLSCLICHLAVILMDADSLLRTRSGLSF